MRPARLSVAPLPISGRKNPNMPPSEQSQTLQQTIARKLTALARQLGPGAQLPTVALLRRELQVSNTNDKVYTCDKDDRKKI